ncbi:MAG: NADPH-dependent FMN reductase [Planctomycetota bacterium]
MNDATTAPKILAFAGSTRQDSMNRKVLGVAVSILREAGGDVTHVELADFPMPLYNGDDEKANGLPEHAARLKKLINEHSGLLLACPEYNSTITPLMKNTIDWCTRPGPKDAPIPQPFTGKVAALVSASDGVLGGLRGLMMVRALLGHIGMLVIPEQVAVSTFKDVWVDGKITDERRITAMQKMAARMVDVCRRMS